MGGLVTVGCKLPNGMILRVQEMVDVQEAAPGGSQTFKRARQIGEPVAIKGPRAPFGQAPKVPVEGGFALTPNVDADFFSKWLEQNADHPAVVNKMIFAHEKPGMAAGQAKEMRKEKSGLEPLVPNTDPRIPRSLNSSVGQIETKKDDDE